MPSKCLLMVRDPQGWWSCGCSQLGLVHGDGDDTKLLPYASDLVTTQVGGDFLPRGTGLCT
jgi:hypothetical protein